MIKTFLQWAEEKNFDLSFISEQPPAKATVDEKQARAGIAHWAYPDGYVRGHYPDNYFMPRAADAAQKMGNHKPKH